jgi:hypothetical protein
LKFPALSERLLAARKKDVHGLVLRDYLLCFADKVRKVGHEPVARFFADRD